MRSRSARSSALAADGGQGARDGDLRGRAQKRQPQKRSGEAQGSREPTRLQRGNTAARLDEAVLAVEANAVRHSQALVEVQQVDAASQEDVLAVVDRLRCIFGRRQGERGGPSAEEGPGFEQGDRKAGARERNGSRHPRQASTGNDYARHVPPGRRKRLRRAWRSNVAA